MKAPMFVVVPVATKLTSTAVAPAGTPDPLFFRSSVRAVFAASGLLGPVAGIWPGRESYTRTGVGSETSAPAVVGPASRRQVPGVPVATQSHRSPAESRAMSPVCHDLADVSGGLV